MKFLAHINVMPKAELLDPQGKVVVKNLPNIGIDGVTDVRIGKHITISLDAASADEAHDQVEMACSKLLANVIMESYDFVIEEL
ncbi:phosphoribosylformylglycinamidine synthase subunit PurS [Neolewinella lacunae]|uniref:Phosphoribosylformylglycinamidine synthase subunit PurS n=1 Tax=Neolewinella lacunae TaxID=1517758 RepID=A0A923TEF2_9BACT|nr:phosphoribosylformylglycinamidine synthase subunit PurS [Neolewinella lacunae]MBC6995847.1 phosphoribosylformylglycinamidine synthase subunit PurS [Neolewinella lacunae]MDN3636460.1 phosphoribosylformylglycinamidine synthase subunit PurS [Neolewinella lacunae]